MTLKPKDGRRLLAITPDGSMLAFLGKGGRLTATDEEKNKPGLSIHLRDIGEGTGGGGHRQRLHPAGSVRLVARRQNGAASRLPIQEAADKLRTPAPGGVRLAGTKNPVRVTFDVKAGRLVSREATREVSGQIDTGNGIGPVGTVAVTSKVRTTATVSTPKPNEE